MPTVQHEDATLYYERSGSGPAIVFAHGAGGNRLSWWQQVPHFSQHYTVLAIDHRGFGRSSTKDFHPRHFRGDVLAILDAEGIDRAAFVCQSMGGWTGLPTALHHPERVACLVLCDTPGGLVTEKIMSEAASIGSRAGSEGIRGNAALAPDFPARQPEMAFLYDQIAALNTHVQPQQLGRMFDPESRLAPADLAHYATPTLLLAGECDQLFSPEALEEVASCIPGAALRKFPGIGHSIYFEDAKAFNRAVDEFLDALLDTSWKPRR